MWFKLLLFSLVLFLGATNAIAEEPNPRVKERVMAKSGVLTPESSGDQIDLRHLDTVFELYSSYHLGQVVEAA